MELNHSLLLLIPIVLPLVAALVMTVIGSSHSDEKTEINISFVSRWAALAHLFFSALIAVDWAVSESLLMRFELFQWADDVFSLVFHVDGAGLLFLILTSFFLNIVVLLSRTYLHRESRFGHFFSVLMVFASGMSMLALADHLEAFFIGWELVGVASFLLIGFYRNRSQPGLQALKVFSIYRLCDVGLLVAALYEHLIGPGFQFSAFQLGQISNSLITSSGALAISLLLLLAASGKSAQFPFTFWLPRAMEGPTPSSAIFYGALSVHAGVFLLYRTFPLWSQVALMPWVVGSVGLGTALISSVVGASQPTIKGRIAYASSAQVGLMFVELALGFPNFALYHLAANSLFRSYQLLVSPSAAFFLLDQSARQSFHGQVGSESASRFESQLWMKLRSSILAFALEEGYLESLFQAFFWKPVRWFGKLSEAQLTFWFLGAAVSGALIWLQFFGSSEWASGLLCLAGVFVAGSSLKSDSIPVQRAAWVAWLSNALNLAGISSGFQSASVHELMVFSIGTSILSVLLWATSWLRPSEKTNTMQFALILALIGFPISPLFFGESLVLDAAFHQSVLSLVGFSVSFVFNGILLMKAYSMNVLRHEGVLRDDQVQRLW